MRTRRWVRPRLALPAATLALLVATRSPGVPDRAALAVSDLSQLGAALVAALWSRAAARSVRRDQRSWQLLAAGCFAWAGGQAVWAFYETVLNHQVPFPSAADFGFLAFPPAALAALALVIETPASRLSRVRAVVEACSITGSLLFISWIVVLSDLFAEYAGSRWATAIAAAYPLADAVLLAICWFALSRDEVANRSHLIGITSGIAAIAVSDTAFLYLTQTGHYSGVELIDLGWIWGFLIFAHTASRARRDPREHSAIRARAQPRLRVSLLAPYVPMLAGAVLAAYRYTNGIELDGFLIADAVVVMALLATQQMIIIFENNAITATLEERVAARTAQIEIAERYYRVLVEGSYDVVMVLDENLRVRDLSASIERIFGIRPDDARGFGLDELFGAHDSEALLVAIGDATSRPALTLAVEWVFNDQLDRRRFVETSITNSLDEPAVRGIVLNSRDITDRKVLEEQLRHQAFHDSLTQLANRALFYDRAHQALARSARTGASIAIMVIDVDDFKTVNDSLGHAAGDEVLAAISERLRRCLRPGDTVARLGGDEFALLLEDGVTPLEANEIAARLLDSIGVPIAIEGRDHTLRATVGIAISSAATRDVGELVRNADTAMYVGKAAGKARSVMFAAQMHHQAVERLNLRTELRTAIDDDQFELYYQPTVDLRTGCLEGFEALLRWRHPERGLLAPQVFIPTAEETGLIVTLGRWALLEACRQAAGWNAPGASPPVTVAVNISARQLDYGGLAADVEAALAASGLDPHLLVLEITESVLVDDSETIISGLHALKALGLRIAIDDFGTGYASLSYLRRLPIDLLKIDKTFVDHVAESEGAAFFKAILNLGQTLQLTTIAEGIERPGQLDVLQSFGCDIGQGFHFSKPVAAREVAALIGSWGSAAFRDAHLSA